LTFPGHIFGFDLAVHFYSSRVAIHRCGRRAGTIVLHLDGSLRIHLWFRHRCAFLWRACCSTSPWEKTLTLPGTHHWLQSRRAFL